MCGVLVLMYFFIEKLTLDKNQSQIFMETPYRNNSLIRQMIETCKPETRLCIAVDITSPTESIQTKTIAAWKKQVPDIHKRLAIFLLHAS